MMMIAERLKDLDKRVERLEREYDEFVASRNAFGQLVENWASRLDDAIKNPAINWVEVNSVVDAMHSFGRKIEK